LSDVRQLNMKNNQIKGYILQVSDQQSLPSLVGEQLRLMITNGFLKPGDKLDSEPNFAKQLNVSRVTLREAIQNLVLEGLLLRRRGIGTFVASYLSVENPLNRNTSVTEFIQSKNAKVNTIDIDMSAQVASAYVAKMLRIQEGDPIVYIKRTRTADDHPVIFSKEHLPIKYLEEHYVGKSLVEDLKEKLHIDQSLNQVLKNSFGIRIDHAFAKISALCADEYLADKLILTTGDCLLRLEQVDFDSQDTPIMLSNEYYPGHSSFTVYRTS
jgi:GntR family transcriptional regulator